MGGGFAAYGELASRSMQREKEAELLFIGEEYRRAIGAYYEGSPAGHKQYPKSLEALLKDERFSFTRRYLRKPYRDPLTGGELVAIEAPQGGIMGVRSRADIKPIRSGNFAQAQAEFEGAPRISDWQFVYSPPPEATPASQPASPASPSGPVAAR